MTEKLVCICCGSNKVYIQAYININNSKTEDDIHFLRNKALGETLWCNGCQTMVSVIPEDEFKVIESEKSIITSVDV